MPLTDSEKRRQELYDWKQWDACDDTWREQWRSVNESFAYELCAMRLDGQFVRAALRYAAEAISSFVVEPHHILGLLLPYYIRAVRSEDVSSELDSFYCKTFSAFATLTELSYMAYRLSDNDGPAILRQMRELTDLLIKQGYLVEEVRDVIDTICGLTEGAMSA